MRAYLDICALKRPFDDRSQPRIPLTVLGLLAAPAERVVFVRAAAQDFENAQNPLAWRAARVAGWLAGVPRSDAKPEELIRRTEELMALGLRNFTAVLAGAGER